MENLKNRIFHFLLIFISFLYIILFIYLPKINLIKDINFSTNNYYALYKRSEIFSQTIIILFVIFILYCLFFYGIKNNFFEIKFKRLFLFSVIVSFFSIIVFPIFSSDIFYYICSDRVFAIHHLSPFTNTYASLSGDYFQDIFHGYSWETHLNNYGPIFILLSSIPVLLFSKNLFLSIVLWKFICIIINIINGYLVYKITKSEKIYFLYAFNPLLIFELCLNAHNEVLMIFFILLAFFYIFKKPCIKNYLLSMVFLVLSILTKIFSLVFLPIFFLLMFLGLKSKKQRFQFLIFSTILLLIIIILSYWPFHTNIKDIISPIIFQSSFTSSIFVSPLIQLIWYGIYFFSGKDFFHIASFVSRFVFLISYVGILFWALFKKNKHFQNLFLYLLQ
jgi:hypothetical protein